MAMLATSGGALTPPLVLDSGVLTASAPIFNLGQTWNNGAIAFTGLKYNVVDTASAAASLLMDLQVGGVSKFSVKKTGGLVVQGASVNDLLTLGGTANGVIAYNSNAGGIAYQFLGDNTGSGGPAELRWGSTALLAWNSLANLNSGARDTGISRVVAGIVGFGTGAQGSTAGGLRAATGQFTTGVYIGSGGVAALWQSAGQLILTNQYGNRIFDTSESSGIRYIKFGGSLIGSDPNLSVLDAYSIGWGNSLFLYRDGAGILAQRNGANEQQHLLYNTYTDVSNYERGIIGFSGSVFYVGTQKNGTGIARSLSFMTDGVGRWNVGATGNLIPAAHNTYDIGGSMSISAVRNIHAAGAIQAAGYFNTAQGGAYLTTGRGGFMSAADGSFRVYNEAGTNTFSITAGASNLATFNGGLFATTLTAASTVQAGSNVVAASNGNFSFNMGSTPALYAGGAGILEQRNGANEQKSLIYNTYTDASNFERALIGFNASVLYFGTQMSGTGTARNVIHLVGGVNKLDYGVTNAGKWTFADPVHFTGAITGPSNTDMFGGLTVNTSGNLLVNSNIFGVGGSGTVNFLVEAAVQNITILNSGMALTWSSNFGGNGTALRAGKDTGLSRISAGVIGVGNGAAGSTAAELRAAKLTLGAFGNSSALGVTAYSLTGSDASSMLDLAGTWNTTGVPTALKLNITNTASGAGALLADLQVGGVSKFHVLPNGNTRLAGNGYNWVIDTNSLGNTLAFSANGVAAFVGITDQGVKTGTQILVAGTTLSAANDLFLIRPAAATLQHGATDSASPIAQKIKFQGVLAGTLNTSGVDASYYGSASTGTGIGGGFQWFTSPAGSTGSTQNAGALSMHLSSANKLYLGATTPTSLNYALWKDNVGSLWVNAETTSRFVHIGAGDAWGMAVHGSGSTGGLSVRLTSTMPLNWGIDNPGSLSDTGLSRVAAGVIGVGTGAQGSVAGGLQAATLAIGGATIGTDLIGAGVSKFRVDSNGAAFVPGGAAGGYNINGGLAAVYSRNSTNLTFYRGGDVAELSVGLFQLSSTVVNGWSSGSIGASSDTGLSRISAGVIGVGTGAYGSIAGSLQLTSVIHAVGTATTPTMTFAGDLTTGIYSVGVGNISFSVSGTERYRMGSGGDFYAMSSISAGQTSAAPFSYLMAPAANTWQFGRQDLSSPVAQTLKFQDVVAGTLNTAGVNATIQLPAGTGTGAGGNLLIQGASAGSSGTAKNAWVTAFTFYPNGSLSINNQLSALGSISTGGAITLGATFNLGWTGRSMMQAPTNGRIAMYNASGTDFDLLQLGGTTNLFPAIKRNGAAISFRLADDSASAPITAASLSLDANGALSTPVVKIDGTWITGGDGVTCTPQVMISPAGTTSGGWHANGTGIGVNAASGFAGHLINLLSNAVSRFSVSAGGQVITTGTFQGQGLNLPTNNATIVLGTGYDTIISRGGAAATLQLGGSDSATPVAQTLQVQSVAAGYTNTAGVDWSFYGSKSTGTGIGGGFKWFTSPAGSTGSTQNAGVLAMQLAANGTLTVPTLAVTHLFGTSASGLLLSTVDYEFVARAGSNNAAHFGAYGIYLKSDLALSWGSSAAHAKTGIDTYLTRGGAATLQHGAADSASPIAQTIKFQDVLAGTTNTSGVNAAIYLPAGTGNGPGGNLTFYNAPAGSSGSAKNAWIPAVTILQSGALSLAGDLNVTGGCQVTFGTNASLRATATNLMRLNNYNATGGATLELREMTAPAAPATDSGRLYLEDNGAGKTRLMIQFATGAAQQVAIEP